jgi:hypothetical protein
MTQLNKTEHCTKKDYSHAVMQAIASSPTRERTVLLKSCHAASLNASLRQHSSAPVACDVNGSDAARL